MAAGNFGTLVQALTAAGLVDTLKGAGPFTVFAPNDAAFAKLPAGVVAELVKPENKASLSRILQYHVTSGNLTAAAIEALTLPANVTMLAGGTTTVTKEGTDLKINGAKVVQADVVATNGIIHGIDAVILPALNIVETAITNGNFQTLITLLKAADLFATLRGAGPFTVFAPTDAAFEKLPNGTIEDLLKPENKAKLANILTSHVVGSRVTSADILTMSLPVQVETLSKLKVIVDKDGTNIKVYTSLVTAADVPNTNGLIHVIDTVILPPTDVVQTAIDNGNFKTLVAALNAAGLVDTLKGAGPFTVFAPTDAAFAKLPAGVVEELLKTENKDSLSKILQYHVTGALFTGASIGRLSLPVNVTMLAGGVAKVSKDGTTVKINDASVTTADIFNANGMIHVIDTVILPPLDIVETAITNGNFKTLIAALKAADLASTLKGAGPFTVFGPNDAAFAKLPGGVVDELLTTESKAILGKILTYHVLDRQVSSADINAMTLPTNITMFSNDTTTISKDGDIIKINGAAVIAADVSNTNGLIHVIDAVILPPLDIVGTAITNGNFQTLITLLKAADLFATLRGAGPFTVFAPTDAAFEKLPNGTIEDLLKPENKGKLADILTTHVLGSLVTSADILTMSLPVQVETLSKRKVIVDKDGTNIKIYTSLVTAANVPNTNGLIHVIDTVILPPTSVVQTAIDNGNFKTLVQALTAAGLVDTLNGDGPFTVFAPTDAAFAKLPAGVVAELVKPENKDSLSKILQYHVTRGLFTGASIGRLSLPVNVTMLAGGVAKVSKDGDTVKVNDASVTTADIFNANGMIHVIDTVILPPLDIVETAITNGNFKTLIAALKAAELVSTLKGAGPLTVFAPNDAAFAKLPAGVVDDLVKVENKDTLAKILKYHVLNRSLGSADINAMTLPADITTLSGDTAKLSKEGATILINGAAITNADVLNTNGYIHVIESVILPPLDAVETAITAGNFQTLVTALRAANLVSTLKGAGPFTIFAPNDAAFDKLPNGTVENWLKPAGLKNLTNTLKYHVVNGKRILAADLKPSQNLEMYGGGEVTVTKVGDKVKINGANVIKADVGSKNAVLHVIDTVLTPQKSSAMSLHSTGGLLVMIVSTLLFLNRSLF